MANDAEKSGDLTEDAQPILTCLSVCNYRCLENVDLPLEQLTAFVGPNGSGKTSLLIASHRSGPRRGLA